MSKIRPCTETAKQTPAPDAGGGLAIQRIITLLNKKGDLSMETILRELNK